MKVLLHLGKAPRIVISMHLHRHYNDCQSPIINIPSVVSDSEELVQSWLLAEKFGNYFYVKQIILFTQGLILPM